MREFPSLQSRGAFNPERVNSPMGARVPVDLALGALGGAIESLPHVVNRCILRVHGRLIGVVVTGCQSTEDSRTAAWIIEDDASSAYDYGPLVSQSCDLFNCWAQREVAAGALSTGLVIFGARRSGAAEVSAESIALDAAGVGCFGEAATARRDAYTLSTGRSHFVGWPSGPGEALAQLLGDLAALGLITLT